MPQAPKKTKGDLFLRLIEEVGGKDGAFLRERFKQEVMPNLKRNSSWDKELTDEEYQRQLVEMKKELPAFIEYITSLPPQPIPDSWKPRQN